MLEKWVEKKFQKGDKGAVEMGKAMIKVYGDEPFPANQVEKPTPITFSKDQLILPETKMPQEVQEVLQRAEKAGFTSFQPYHLSGVTLTQGTIVPGWNSKPEDWYWDRIRNGKLSKDASKLPDSWVLVDTTQRPNYKGGMQLHENDSFGPFLKQLRDNKRIQTIKGIPDTSRFSISPDELTQVVLPGIARLLEVESPTVRFPKEIEFNIIGNFKYPEWGQSNTWEWLDDSFGDGSRLLGGLSGDGGLTRVIHRWSGVHYDGVAFRPLVVISPRT